MVGVSINPTIRPHLCVPCFDYYLCFGISKMF